MGDSMNVGDENVADSTGTMPPNSSVDPNGFQSAATVSAGAGLGLLAGGSSGEMIGRLLGLGSSDVLTAGFSLVSLGRVSLFTAGLVLVGLSIVLNVASLVTRWQNWYTERRLLQECYRKMQALQTRSRSILKAESTGTMPPNSRIDPNG